MAPPSLPPSELSHKDISLEFGGVLPGNPDRGFVPSYHFRILNHEQRDVGHLNVRVGNTDHIRLAAGHIGFEIHPDHRGHHYALKACLAIGPWASGILDEILITTDPDNAASIRTIELLGATFMGLVDVPKNDPHYQRGSFQKRVYQWMPEPQ